MWYPEKIRAWFWRAMVWVAVAAVGLVPRLILLARVETRLDADESIVGLMALRAVQHGDIPVFFWGQHYGGGHVIEALLASVFFRIWGPSAAALQMVPALFAVGVVLLVFAYVRDIWGARTAAWAALAVSFSTPFLKSSLKADGYIETIFLIFLGLFLLHKLRGYMEEKRSAGALVTSFFMAAAFGLAWWSYDFALPAAVVAAVIVMRMKLLRGIGHAFVMLFGFLSGAALIIFDNVFNDFENVSHLTKEMNLDAPLWQHFIFSVKRLFEVQLPAFLTRECVHVFVTPPPLEAWVFLAVIGLGVVVLLQQRRRSNMPAAWAMIPALYIVLYCATRVSGIILPEDPNNFRTVWTVGRSPRYLLPLEPYLTLFAVLGLGILAGSRRAAARYMSVLAGPALAAALALGMASILADNTIYEGNVKTDPESITNVVHFLKLKKIECVHTTYFIKWRILFESRETVTAVDSLIMSGEKRGFDFYEKTGCPDGRPPAFVFHRDSPAGFLINEQIEMSRFPYHEPQYIRDHIVMYPKTKEELEEEEE